MAASWNADSFGQNVHRYKIRSSLVEYKLSGAQTGAKRAPDGMALIPGGAFMMGNSDSDSNGRPEHQISIEAFYLDKHETTVAQYRQFINAAGHRQPDNWDEQLQKPEHSKHPVVNVSWDDANAYAKWAGKRLPTEAEWEYASRGGFTGVGGKPKYKYPWGNEASHEQANYLGKAGKDQWDGTSSVGSFSPNGYGLYDMAGNAIEWCADWSDPNYYKNSPSRNPKGPDTGTYRVLRGGAWNLDCLKARCSARRGRNPKVFVGGFVGFRCARDVR